MNIDEIKKINKTVIKEDGNLISFDKQLIQLMSGTYDTSFPLIISDTTKSLSYIDDVNINNPITINSSTVIKIREKHDIGYDFVSDCEKFLKESAFAFESNVHSTSKIVILDEVDDDNNSMVAICRTDKQVGIKLMVNEITSIYDKKNLEKMIVKAYEQNGKIYKNKKTEQYVQSIGFCFPQELTYALSTNYNRTSFTKSQVEIDLKIQQYADSKQLNEEKEREKDKMKEQDRGIYYVTERLGIGDFLDYKQSLDRLEMGVSLGMEAFIDKEGKFYSQYDLEEMFRNISIDEEDEFSEKKGIKKCFIEIKDVEDCQFFQSKYVSNCIINPAVMDLNTSRKFNRTIEVLTDPLYCFNKEKCSQIKNELIEAKPLTVLKLDSFTRKYIDDKALETLKIVVDNPMVYETIVNEIDWSSYADNLNAKLETSRDIDKADTPKNNLATLNERIANAKNIKVQNSEGCKHISRDINKQR